MLVRQIARWVLLAFFAVAVIAPASAQAQKTATQFYMEYVAAFATAKTIEDILPFMAAENRKQVEATPKDERNRMFEMIKMLSHTDIKVLKEEAGPNGSTILAVEGIDSDRKNSSGTITLVKEGTDWKIGKESWTTKG